ncbi:MAG TPA: Asp-tRNA(Asn)/Glu-tRNA(Gln) amidotransferase subunit GatB [Candidatus Paceibacterota bacterium]|jgi:aspartyl-tRNA(Asn)/glutamyl-tRNA(Gln) amidotransferase subunit B|nr:Asp-tRNA(Asn)/Glu-tRNA(Gln) amidotransferase subunit GatB [Candidatus Paceibacterota bacterium]
MEYKPTIGLEVHAELKTRTKMFCDSLNDPDENHPNVNVCPVCLGHPGTLPVANKAAIAHVLKVGMALGGAVNETTKFDRKNYFYPDLPKGYQISQYDKPLVTGGALKGVRIRRIHLEEDTGTLIHAEGASLVDYNRSGVPLMELVTEPDLTSGEDTAAFARELQLILRYLGVSDADMEKGEMRIEANVSLNMGTKVELKNINSFRAVLLAVKYELARQEEALKNGEKLTQETRGWDEAKQKTVPQRSKEEAHDYRYFPEPDLPPFETAVFGLTALRDSIPELPAQKRARFAKEYGLDPTQAEILVNDPDTANYFEEAISELKERFPKTPKAAVLTLYNYLTSDLRGLMNQKGVAFADLKVDPEHLAHLAGLLEEKKITSRQAKDMLARMFDTGLDPEEIVKSESVGISGTDEVEAVVLAVIAEHKAAVDDYRKGKLASLQFLIGQAMARLKGRARPDMLKEIFEKNLHQ